MSLNQEERGKVFERKTDKIVLRKVAGETLLVPIRGNLADIQRVFWLNPVAEYIWGQLDGKSSSEEILDRILGKFETEEEQAKADLEEFMSELLGADLISRVG